MRGMGNMQGMMKQVQKMQKEMAKAQEQLHAQQFVHASANELVTVTMTGDRRLVDVTIKPELLDPEDVEMLQDLLVATLNDTLATIDAQTERTMGQYTRGFNLPF